MIDPTTFDLITKADLAGLEVFEPGRKPRFDAAVAATEQWCKTDPREVKRRAQREASAFRRVAALFDAGGYHQDPGERCRAALLPVKRMYLSLLQNPAGKVTLVHGAASQLGSRGSPQGDFASGEGVMGSLAAEGKEGAKRSPGLSEAKLFCGERSEAAERSEAKGVAHETLGNHIRQLVLPLHRKDTLLNTVQPEWKTYAALWAFALVRKLYPSAFEVSYRELGEVLGIAGKVAREWVLRAEALGLCRRVDHGVEGDPGKEGKRCGAPGGGLKVIYCLAHGNLSLDAAFTEGLRSELMAKRRLDHAAVEERKNHELIEIAPTPTNDLWEGEPYVTRLEVERAAALATFAKESHMETPSPEEQPKQPIGDRTERFFSGFVAVDWAELEKAAAEAQLVTDPAKWGYNTAWSLE